MKAQSALSVKEANLKAMTAFIYTQGSATKQMFEHELGLSLPTITQNLRAMEADGLIVKGEMQQSTGGRKAQIYEFAAHSSVAIGVRIQTTQITAIAIDLNGKSVATRQRTLPYRNNDAYYQRMNGIINDFAQELAKQGSTVLGVAFCMQGIVSADGQQNHGQHRPETQRTQPRPQLSVADDSRFRRFCHGGTLVRSQSEGCRLHLPRTTPRRRGHRGRIALPRAKPMQWLNRTYDADSRRKPLLLRAIRLHGHVLLRSVLAGDVIISGEAAQYLDDDDMAGLRERVVEHTPFGTTDFTLRKGMALDHQDIIGAALRFVEPYVRELCGM